MSVSGSNIFIERSIMSALSFIKESIFSDELASKKGLMQSIDPRIKLVTFGFIILTVLFTQNIFVVLSLYGICLLITRFSGVNIIFFLKRTWIFIPLFSLFIAIPALFNFFSPGDAIASFKIFGVNFSITRQGLGGAALFVARVITSVSFAVLLSITTRHFQLLKVLRVFKVPQVFVMILGICYRYIFLFTEIIENTYLAIKARVGRRVHYSKGHRIVAWNIASLWHRSYELNEKIYGAMIARGYSGEPVVVTNFKTEPKDWVWFFFALSMCTALLWMGR